MAQHVLSVLYGARMPPKDSQTRREVAADMLAMAREDGEPCAGEAAFATSKWATVFKSELEIVARTGRCPPMLYDCLHRPVERVACTYAIY